MDDGTRGLSRAQLGELNARRFADYVLTGLEQGTLEWEGGKLSRTRISEQLGFSRSTFQQNPKVRTLLAVLEGGASPDALDGTVDGRLISLLARRSPGKPVGDDALERRAAGYRELGALERDREVQRLRERLAVVTEENRHLRERLRAAGFADLELPETGRLPW
jgi:hypothetical protein